MDLAGLIARDSFAASLGARLVEAGPRRVVVAMDVAPHHRDESGRLATGALFALADCAMSLISNASGTAVAVATHFIRSGSGESSESVRAVARPSLEVDGRAASWLIVVEADGQPIASFTGTTFSR